MSEKEKAMALVLTVFVVLAAFLLSFDARASDPAGTWSKCANQVGDIIIVEGPRCPKGWRKIY